MPTSSSRRQFLGTLASTAGMLAFASASRLLASEPTDKSAKAGQSSDAPADSNSLDPDGAYGGFRMGIQSYTLRNFPLDKTIEMVHTDLGLSAIEFFSVHVATNASDEQIKKIKDKTAEVGIKLTSHGVNNFSKNHDANRKLFDFAKKMGLKNITADPTEDAFDSLDKLVDEYGINIAIHNHGPGARYSKVVEVLNAIKDHNQRIGACADLGHYIRSGEDPVKAITLLEGRLYGVHLKDYDKPQGNAKGVVLGQGQLDLEGVFKALHKVKFPADGFISLEYEEKPDDPLADLQQCLAAAADAAQKVAKG